MNIIESYSTLGNYLRYRWKEYILPVIGPIGIFIASYFTTNIGWRALPMALVVVWFMFVLKTIELRNRWNSYRQLIANQSAMLKNSSRRP